MKRMLCLLLPLLLMQGCSKQEPLQQEYYIQEVAHLYPHAALSQPAQASVPEDTVPLNYDDMRAVWIPVMQYGEWMTGQSADAFRQHVRTAFAHCADMGINTVYLHVRAYGDAYYSSSLFPKGAYLDGDYDPLAIMLEEAHALALSVHAWINPMRLSSADGLAETPESYPLYAWYHDAEKNGTYLVQSGANFYLNPAYPEVRQFIADGVTEILEHYAVDGIHIDDYFYPTQDTAFDAAAFAESGASDLAAWRRENCNAMVQEMYHAVKAQDEQLLFGISPQGNMRTNFDKLYADTALWCREAGYCDYIVPQVYYGFENSTCPFAETAALWAETADSARLVIGLAPYKIGLTDQWAGSGSEEWKTDSTVLSRQAELILSMENVGGMAFYSYASLFAPEEQAAATVSAEVQRISDFWQDA